MERELGYNIYDLLPTPPSVGSYFNGALTQGNKDYSNQFTDGFSLANMRDSQVGGDMRSANFVTGTDGWIIYANGDVEFNDGTFRGTLTATSGTIGGFNIGSDYIRDVADSFGMASTVSGSDDVRFWAGDTYANRATADFRVTEAGAVVCSNITITGGAVSGASIASIPNNTTTDISLLQFSHNLVFSSSDLDTIAWTSGTIVMSHGRTFAIDAGNTGNMAGITYIYLDPAVSSTVLQTTTTYSTATGANKIVIAVAQNHAISASVIPFGGGQPLLDGSTQINALSIVAGNIAASTITAGKLSVSQLSAITADLGTITAGTVTGATIQTASSGTRFVMTSTAFQGIDSGGDVVFEVIISGGDAGDVIMGDDASGNYAKWDNSAGTFDIFKAGSSIIKFGGDGSDGALTLTSGTTTVNLAGAKIVVLNYTTISITGTGQLAFSNPHSSGTVLIIKCQGNCTITSSANPAIDASGLGGEGGAGGVDGGAAAVNGVAGTDGIIPGYGLMTNNGVEGTTGPVPGAGGAQTTSVSVDYSSLSPDFELLKYPFAFLGAGGGGGLKSGTGAIGGLGGRGGAALIMEVAGAWDRTSNISVAGKDGGAPTAGSGAGYGAGGGSGGFFLALVNAITTNSGSNVVTGGAGSSGTAGGGAGGGGGGSPVAAGSNASGSNGGNGAAGLSMGVNVNTLFA